METYRSGGVWVARAFGCSHLSITPSLLRVCARVLFPSNRQGLGTRAQQHRSGLRERPALRSGDRLDGVVGPVLGQDWRATVPRCVAALGCGCCPRFDGAFGGQYLGFRCAAHRHHRCHLCTVWPFLGDAVTFLDGFLAGRWPCSDQFNCQPGWLRWPGCVWCAKRLDRFHLRGVGLREPDARRRRHTRCTVEVRQGSRATSSREVETSDGGLSALALTPWSRGWIARRTHLTHDGPLDRET